jgi:alpha-L-rhamnosidase
LGSSEGKGKAGDIITLSHAEVLDKKGNFYTENLRLAKQQNTYILKGGGEETFEPHFTWQGFRYIKVEGVPGELKAGELYGRGFVLRHDANRQLHLF